MSPETITFTRFLIFGACLWTIGETANRSRRELKFPKGCSLVTGVAVTSILPKGLTDGFVHVLEFDLGFPFPEQSIINEVSSKKKVSFWKNPYQSLMMRKGFEIKRKAQKKYRSRRNVKDEQKRKLLLKVEDAIARLGYDGRACVDRFQCELNTITPGNSLLEDVLLSLFKTSQFSNKECSKIQEYCSVSLLHVLLHSEQMITISE